jgi:DNA modification methylase
MTEIVVGDARVVLGDCRDVLRTLADNSVDSVVTDPPYELGFMGKSWDSTGIAYDVTVWQECLRVLKPGGHILAFGGSRTWHRLSVAVEDAGFEIRDSICWLYGSGFPKSLDVSKAIDKRGGVTANFVEFRDAVTFKMKENSITNKQLQKALGNFMVSHYLTKGDQPAIPNWRDYQIIRDTVGLGSKFDNSFMPEAEREVLGMGAAQCGQLEKTGVCDGHFDNGTLTVTHQLATAPSTVEAQQWSGWGTALKPAFEPVVVGRKPFGKGVTVAENVLAWGVGGLNIDASRIGTNPGYKYRADKNGTTFHGKQGERIDRTAEKAGKDFLESSQGRWPANVILDEVTAGLLDEQSGISGSGKMRTEKRERNKGWANSSPGPGVEAIDNYGDSGGASRFFYQAKASKRDRNEGLEGLPLGEILPQNNSSERKEMNANAGSRVQNFHPTVKPTQLMRYLIKLVTPPGGTVLDPFTGSGSTGKAALLDGFKFVGAELTAEYLPIIEGRLRWALEHADVDETLF